ncbi:hypothetical protein BJ165DRAFT_1524707 [Panaeolus papilionaceus]|nr:hypothetical protein BJ165DRAFT_1524707 [Panaeolus papilionaceus]
MGAKKKKPTKRRSLAQQLVTLKASEACRKVKTPSTKRAMAKAKKALEVKIKKSIKPPNETYEELERNFKNLYRRHTRLKVSKTQKDEECHAHKTTIEHAENTSRKLKKRVNELSSELAKVYEMVKVLKAEGFGAEDRRERTNLSKANGRMRKQIAKYKEHVKRLLRLQPRRYNLFKKGTYTRQARALARYMVSKGMAEKHVGLAIQEIGRVLGIKVGRRMDQRTVQRCTTEVGVAADIQLAYEVIASNIPIQRPTSVSNMNLGLLPSKLWIAEFCVLALYHRTVSRPFMETVRRVHNLLELESFFSEKVSFLEKVSLNPSIWIDAGWQEEETMLGGGKWSSETHDVFAAVHNLRPSLPHLAKSVSAFTSGARDAMVNRFSDEFKDDSDISRLSTEERSKLHFASTNDFNEGALGSMRLAQRHRPAETLHKFNASFKSHRNDTETFIEAKLNTIEDDKYLRKVARTLDSSKQTQKRKQEQIVADNLREGENKEKLAKRVEKENQRMSDIADTEARLILDELDVTDNLTVDELNRQLDYHREAEKVNPLWINHPLPVNRTVPLKSHMKRKSDRILELKWAISRFHLRNLTKEDLQSSTKMTKTTSGEVVVSSESNGSIEPAYESDYDDDMDSLECTLRCLISRKPLFEELSA